MDGILSSSSPFLDRVCANSIWQWGMGAKDDAFCLTSGLSGCKATTLVAGEVLFVSRACSSGAGWRPWPRGAMVVGV